MSDELLPLAPDADEALRISLADAALPTDAAAVVAQRLRLRGWHVTRSWHDRPVTERHGPGCYHCGRPENPEPFVVPGTQIELYSSEGDHGRWRHWGGDDSWVCRVHPHDMDGDVADTSYTRGMGLFEALEHAAARDGVPGAIQITNAQVNAAAVLYGEAHRERLAALDASAPLGGHAGVGASAAAGTAEQVPE